jgi:hypothetical protein
MKRILALIAITAVFGTASASAQTIEDALRYGLQSNVVSARSAGMGNAFTGLANDLSALYWNPAGLGQLRYSLMDVGLTSFSANTDATILGSTTSDNMSVIKFNNIGLAIPVPVNRGSLVFAAGYNRLTDFSNRTQVDVYNPYSSIQPSFFDPEPDYDMAWNLGLEDVIVDSLIDAGAPGWLAIPVFKNVQQNILIEESGGMNQWAFGGSMEVARGAYFGATFNILTGSYRYDRTFTENDVNNQHQEGILGIDNRMRNDFQQLIMRDSYEQDVDGWNFGIGFLYNYQDKFRAGVNVRTPTYYTIYEDYRQTGQSFFANDGLYYEQTWQSVTYYLNTPWQFSFGVSGSPVEWVTLSGDIDIMDYQSMEYDGSNLVNRTALNDDIRRNFRSTNNYRLGAEVNVPRTDLYLRGGFGYSNSAYKDDRNTSDYDAVSWSAGLGYFIGTSVIANVAYMNTSVSGYFYNYNEPDADVPEAAFRTERDISNGRILFSLAYRF